MALEGDFPTCPERFSPEPVSDGKYVRQSDA
jgi:hypothetical protein